MGEFVNLSALEEDHMLKAPTGLLLRPRQGFDPALLHHLADGVFSQNYLRFAVAFISAKLF
jgi:hypothetical protein